MTRYVALLRAVNVGGTGKLSMKDLVRLCEAAGFRDVQTLLASGNALFSSDLGPAEARAALARQLESHAGRPVGVLLRDAQEMARICDEAPFSGRDPRLAHVIFLDVPPPEETLETVKGPSGEEIRLGCREIYVYYPDGAGRSKLRIPAAREGTARNLNTVARIAALLAEP